MTNKIAGVPSGVVLNCQNEVIYNMYLYGFVRYKETYKGNEIRGYLFKDELYKDLLEYISDSVKEGDFIYDKISGYGMIVRINSTMSTIYHEDGAIQGIYTKKLVDASTGIYFVNEDDIDSKVLDKLKEY